MRDHTTMKKRFTAMAMATCMAATFLTGCKMPWDQSESVENHTSSGDVTVDADEKVDNASAFLNYKVDYETIEPTSENNPDVVIARVKYPVLRLGDYEGNTFVESEEYPELSAGIAHYNDDSKAVAEGEKDILIEYAESDLAYAEESGDLEESEGMDIPTADRYVYEATPIVSRADTNAFSVLEMQYYDANGAHPTTTYVGYNFDSKSGEEIALSSIVEDKEKFVNTVMEQLSVQNPEGYGKEELEYLFVDDLGDYIADALDDDSLTWDFTSDGVEIIFNSYEIASYANGPAFIDLSFEEYGDLFSEDYQDVPSDYVKALTSYVTYPVGDHTILISYATDEETYEVNGVKLVYDEKGEMWEEPDATLEVDDPMKMDFYLFHKEDQNYLYVNYSNDGKYQLAIYDLNTDELEEVTYEDSDTSLMEFVPGNPENFLMGKAGNLIGEYTMFRHASVGESGLPEFAGEYYMIDAENITLTTKKDIDTIQLKVDTKEEFTDSEDSQKVTLKAGTKLSLYRTDGDEILDVKDADGNIYRLTITAGGHIGGSSVTDVLDVATE